MGNGLLSKLKESGIDGSRALRGIVRGNRQATGFGDIGVNDEDSGLSVGRNPLGSPFNCFGLATVVSQGTDEQDDFTDARYWLKWGVPDAGGYYTKLTLGASTEYDPQIFPATNIAELPTDGSGGGTHTVPIGTVVYVFAFEGTGSERFLFSSNLAGTPNVVVRFDTIISSQWGKYNGTIFSGPPDAVTGAALAMPEGLTSGDTCVIYYGDDAITHKAKLGVFAEGRFLGNDPDTGTAIVLVNMTKGRNYGDGPNDSGIDFNNALNYEWIRDAQPDGSFGFGDGALELGVVVGGSYDSGTKQLRLWVERLRFDADGRLEKALSPDGDIDQYIDLSGLLP